MINSMLCVDDDDIAQFYMSVIIDDSSFIEHTFSVYNGQKALEYLDKIEETNNSSAVFPQLILLDLNMPVMDGWEFLEAFSKKYPDRYQSSKVAIVSSTVDPSDFAKARNYPFVIEFITKPISSEVLKSIDNRHFTE